MQYGESEAEFMYELVYMWQQNSGEFNKKLPEEIKEYFLKRFTKPPKDLVLYRGMHVSSLNEIRDCGDVFASTTTDYNQAKDFALGMKNYFYNEGLKCIVFKVIPELVFLVVNKLRDFGEDEIICYRPRYEIYKILD